MRTANPKQQGKVASQADPGCSFELQPGSEANQFAAMPLYPAFAVSPPASPRLVSVPS